MPPLKPIANRPSRRFSCVFRTSLLLLGGLLGLTGVILPSNAETYIWKDAAGKTIISDSPPPRTSKPARNVGVSKAPIYTQPAQENGGNEVGTSTPVDTAAQPEAAPAAPPPKSMADRELEFRKRQMETRDREEKAAQEAQAKAQRRDECARATQYLEALRNGQRIARFNDKGEREIIGDEQRDAEIARAKQSADNLCK